VVEVGQARHREAVFRGQGEMVAMEVTFQVLLEQQVLDVVREDEVEQGALRYLEAQVELEIQIAVLRAIQG